jgi:hypothetical protein
MITYTLVTDSSGTYEFAVEDNYHIHFINFYKYDNSRPERIQSEDVPTKIFTELLRKLET